MRYLANFKCAYGVNRPHVNAANASGSHFKHRVREVDFTLSLYDFGGKTARQCPEVNKVSLMRKSFPMCRQTNNSF